MARHGVGWSLRLRLRCLCKGGSVVGVVVAERAVHDDGNGRRDTSERVEVEAGISGVFIGSITQALHFVGDFALHFHERDYHPTRDMPSCEDDRGQQNGLR